MRLQETTLSLKPQVGGYFDYGGTFSSLKNGEVHAMCGIGDWITGVLKKDGAPVDSVVPKQGSIQFTESYSIGKGSSKQDLVKEFIRYMTSGPGQVRSAQMAAYPVILPYRSGWKALQEANPKEVERQGMVEGKGSAIEMLREGRIHFRGIPAQPSLEEWNDFWSEYKNAQSGPPVAGRRRPSAPSAREERAGARGRAALTGRAGVQDHFTLAGLQDIGTPGFVHLAIHTCTFHVVIRLRLAQHRPPEPWCPPGIAA